MDLDKEMKAATDRRYTLENPAYRKAYMETMDRVSKLSPREILPQRRFLLKAMRFQGTTPELVARARAIREAATKEINR